MVDKLEKWWPSDDIPEVLKSIFDLLEQKKMLALVH
jgi:hypothetical protein